MSNYWMLHCQACDQVPVDVDGFNRGQEILRSIYRLREHIIAIGNQDTSNYLSVEIMAHPDVSGLWTFLSEHKDHEMDLLSEYGYTEPIEVPS